MTDIRTYTPTDRQPDRHEQTNKQTSTEINDNLYRVFLVKVKVLPSGHVAQLVVQLCFGGRGFESHRGQKFFLFLRVGHFLSRPSAQKVLFGIFIRAL